MIPDFDQQGKAQTKEWVPEITAPAILLENVSKSYGRIFALSNITLALNGGVTGVLGMNGAGKSTLFNLLMGKIKVSQGTIKLFGTDPWKNPAPYARVGFVPEHENMYGPTRKGPNQRMGAGNNYTCNTFGKCIKKLWKNLRFVKHHIGIERRSHGCFRDEWSRKVNFVQFAHG